jgi:hypothetical protein
VRENLLAWQWGLYPDGHRDRKNLVLHAVTVPVFQLGTLALFASLFLGALFAVGGLAAMLLALTTQGAGHRKEIPPVPFLGPIDFVSRFFAEQWVTFPRYVLSGGFLRSWRGRD